MGQIRSKKEWVCKECSAKHLTFEGFCRQCGAAGTLEEVVLVVKKTASETQKSIRRRSKNAERNIARKMTQLDGRDSNFDRIATSTGRVGQYTNLQFDAVSKTYATEAKNRRLPAWLLKSWVQIQQISINLHKNALLYLEPPNAVRDFPLNGEKHKNSMMHIITEYRHEQLIGQEQLVDVANEILSSKGSDAQILYELKSLFGRLNQ